MKPPPGPRTRPRTPVRVIALMNQKGGVGKTTSTVNLGAALARSGKRTLLIDLDPQAHLTLHVGIDPNQLDHSVYDLLTCDTVTVHDVIQTVDERLDVLAGHVNLAGVEAELAPKMVTGRAQSILKEKCQTLCAGLADQRDAQSTDAKHPATPHAYEYVLIDCPPSLGLLTINALVLAQEVLVPMQAQFLALQGLSQLLETVRLISQSFNPGLTVSGIVLCMHENQTLLSQEVLSDLASFLDSSHDQDVPWRDAKVLDPPVRRNIKLAECPSFGKTIFGYAPQCHGAADYLGLAASLIKQAESTNTPEPADQVSRDEPSPLPNKPETVAASPQVMIDTRPPIESAVEPAEPQDVALSTVERDDGGD